MKNNNVVICILCCSYASRESMGLFWEFFYKSKKIPDNLIRCSFFTSDSRRFKQLFFVPLSIPLSCHLNQLCFPLIRRISFFYNSILLQLTLCILITRRFITYISTSIYVHNYFRDIHRCNNQRSKYREVRKKDALTCLYPKKKSLV